MACLPYAPGMAAALALHVRNLPDYERQLHVLYLANDILLKRYNNQALMHHAHHACCKGHHGVEHAHRITCIITCLQKAVLTQLHCIMLSRGLSMTLLLPLQPAP